MISLKQRSIFYENLKRQLSAGYPIIKALYKSYSLSAPRKLKIEIKKIIYLLEQNHPFNEAIKGCTFLPPEEKVLLGVAFANGTITETLEELIYYLHKILALKRQVIISLLPSLVTANLALTILPLIRYHFFNQPIPATPFFAIMGLNGFVLISYFFSRPIMSLTARVLIYLPLVRTILIKFNLFKFFLLLYEANKAGIPITQGLDMAKEVITLPSLSPCIKETLNMAHQHQNIFSPLYRCPLVDNSDIHQWEVAHESGTADEALQDLSQRNLQEGVTKLKLLSFIIQKIILIAITILIFYSLQDLLFQNFKL